MPRRQSKHFVTYFHRGDWKKDTGVNLLTSFEKGIWVEIIFMLDESPSRGYAVHSNGKVMSLTEVATAAKSRSDSLEDAIAAVERLVEIGVASIDTVRSSPTRGALFCRRIVRDEMTRSVNSKNGSKGGNPNFRELNRISDDFSSKKPELSSDSKQSNLENSVHESATPSLPVSSLPVESKEKDTPDGVSKKKATRIDPDYSPSPAVRDSIQKKCPNVDVAWELEKFIDHFSAVSGKRGLYTDWDATFRNWCKRAEEKGGTFHGKRQFKTSGDKQDDGFKRELDRLAELGGAVENHRSDQRALPPADGDAAAGQIAR